MTKLAKYKKAFIKTVKGNKQLIIGVAIGALIMLPTGLYANHRVSNSQRTPREPQGGTTTAPQLDTSSEDAKTLSPTTVPSGATTSTSKSSSASSKGRDYNISETCVDKIIPFNTYYRDDPYMPTGDIKVITEGINGLEEDCTQTFDGKDWGTSYGFKTSFTRTIRFETHKIVSRGVTVEPQDTSPATPTYTQEQAQQMARNACAPIAQAGASSAYQSCISSALRQYGY